MNYAQLTEAIKGYVENDFPTITFSEGSFTSAEQIARFVEMAEQRIYNTVQFPALRKNSTGTLTSSNKYLATPSDFLSTYSLAVVDGSGNYHYLLNKDVNFMREAYPNPSSTGLPVHYAYFDDNTFILGPTPDSGYAVELHYFYYPESIVTAGTSWLGDNFDSVLLNASLLEAAIFMKAEQDLMAEYNNRYVQSLAIFKNLGDGKLRGDAYRDGQIKVAAV